MVPFISFDDNSSSLREVRSSRLLTIDPVIELNPRFNDESAVSMKRSTGMVDDIMLLERSIPFREVSSPIVVVIVPCEMIRIQP